MGTKDRIIKQVVYLTYEAAKEPKDGKYFITLILRDTDEKEYVFRSSKRYNHDESGLANFDLEIIQTANFTSGGLKYGG